MTIEIYLAYIAACILGAIIPGPSVTLIVATSLTHGTRAGLLNILGGQSGLVLMLGVLVVGRAAVVEAMGRWVDADAGVRIAVSSAALTDKSPHVRRTAAEALAPAVKHPEVQETLARCAEDRDLSVSEAAERLLRFRPL